MNSNNFYQIKDRTTAEEFIDIVESLFKDLGDESNDGGAILASSITNIRLKYCLFSKNVAKRGGGLFADNSYIHMFSTCFDSCRGSVINANDGGNAIAYLNTPMFIEYSSAIMCAPDVLPSADGTFTGTSSTSDVWAMNLNFTKCKGKLGECSLGNVSPTKSKVKYMNVAHCEEYDLLMLPGSNVLYANFLDNVLTDTFIHGQKVTTLKWCSFFGNTKKNDEITNVYIDCVGDISRNNLNPCTSTKTFAMSQIEYQKCIIRLFGRESMQNERSLGVALLSFFALLVKRSSLHQSVHKSSKLLN